MCIASIGMFAYNLYCLMISSTILHRKWFLFFLLVVYGSCGENRAQELPTVTLRVGGQSIEAELALRPEEQARGLMYRKELGEMRGMLFLFSRDRVLRFYMKNTLIPLTIAYLDKEGVIQELHDMQALDEATVASQWPLRFALEMNQGWFGRYGVRVGELVTLADGSPLVTLLHFIDISVPQH